MYWNLSQFATLDTLCDTRHLYTPVRFNTLVRLNTQVTSTILATLAILTTLKPPFLSCSLPSPRGAVLPYMGYIGIWGPKGYGFSAVLVINRVSILAILILNRVWVWYSSLELRMLIRRSYLFIIIDKTIS